MVDRKPRQPIETDDVERGTAPDVYGTFVHDPFRLGLLTKFLALAILAVGLDLIWGYGGILSLGHGVFFGLGAYAMAMYLKLDASGASLPDFMGWSG